jgi:hypothetical protein
MTKSTESRTRTKLERSLAEADEALRHGRYFEAEEFCLDIVDVAAKHDHFDLVAQAVMPLLEARRQRRVAAVDTGRLFIVEGDLPHPPDLEPGVYLLQPPRVGVDGKRLRHAAGKLHIPTLVLVREPTTQMGLIPVVALAQRTIRTQVRPYTEPSIEWVLSAAEALGDVAIDMVDVESSPADQVELLIECIHTHPDHEKLHQRLAKAAHEASRTPRPNNAGRGRNASELPDDDDDVYVEEQDDDF